GLKIPRPYGHLGSIPSSGTINKSRVASVAGLVTLFFWHCDRYVITFFFLNPTHDLNSRSEGFQDDGAISMDHRHGFPSSEFLNRIKIDTVLNQL
ncbi:MAG: hypothetical protein M0P57_12990, partial [Syntrophales bacterium]|nr:hypothetical protein [Syntrophales bacterium]